jgi:hypothetical protein
MMLAELRELLRATPPASAPSIYREAVLESNVLAKGSESARQRSFRYLRELYGLDPRVPTFSALRVFWDLGEDAQPLMALSSALTRDQALRATAPGILKVALGARVTADDLAQEVIAAYPTSYSEAVARKIGRNAASTWTQSGHLMGRTTKVRIEARPSPASIAYALYLSSLEGRQGEPLFDSTVVAIQDAAPHVLRGLARAASRFGWIDYRSIGQVTEVGFAYVETSAAALS